MQLNSDSWKLNYLLQKQFTKISLKDALVFNAFQPSYNKLGFSQKDVSKDVESFKESQKIPGSRVNTCNTKD